MTWDQDLAAKSAIGKAARRLLPFLCLCYAVNFLDRVNVGFAALAMNQDLGFTQSIFGASAGILFIGYLLFEVPSNLALQHFGARVWIARIMVSWGLVAMAMAVVSGPASFYAMRFLLGVAEAGFFPGIILYLTYWFPAHERARIVSLFMAAGRSQRLLVVRFRALCSSCTGWAAERLHWLFIIEGLPAVLLGFAALKLLPDRPAEAPWLTRMKSMRSKPSSRQKPRRRVTRAITRDQAARPRARTALFSASWSDCTASAFGCRR